MGTKAADYSKIVMEHAKTKHGGKSPQVELRDVKKDANGVPTSYDVFCKEHNELLCKGPIEAPTAVAAQNAKAVAPKALPAALAPKAAPAPAPAPKAAAPAPKAAAPAPKAVAPPAPKPAPPAKK